MEKSSLHVPPPLVRAKSASDLSVRQEDDSFCLIKDESLGPIRVTLKDNPKTHEILPMLKNVVNAILTELGLMATYLIRKESPTLITCGISIVVIAIVPPLAALPYSSTPILHPSLLKTVTAAIRYFLNFWGHTFTLNLFNTSPTTICEQTAQIVTLVGIPSTVGTAISTIRWENYPKWKKKEIINLEQQKVADILNLLTTKEEDRIAQDPILRQYECLINHRLTIIPVRDPQAIITTRLKRTMAPALQQARTLKEQAKLHDAVEMVGSYLKQALNKEKKIDPNFYERSHFCAWLLTNGKLADDGSGKVYSPTRILIELPAYDREAAKCIHERLLKINFPNKEFITRFWSLTKFLLDTEPIVSTKEDHPM